MAPAATPCNNDDNAVVAPDSQAAVAAAVRQLLSVMATVPLEVTLSALDAACEPCCSSDVHERLRRVIEAHHATLATLSAQCKRLREVNRGMATELERQRQLCKAYENDALLGVRRLQKSEQAHREARLRCVQADEEATAALQEQRRTLGARQASLRGSIAKQQQVVQCEEKKLAKLYQREEQLRAEIGTLQSAVDLADAQVQRLRQQVQDSDAAASEAQRRLQEGEARMAATQLRLEFQELQITELTQDLESARRRAQQLRENVCNRIMTAVA